jgi:hypothetical protein
MAIAPTPSRSQPLKMLLLVAAGLPARTAVHPPPERWLAYLRAVYGGAESDAELLAAVPREGLRFLYLPDEHLRPVVDGLLNASETCVLGCAEYCSAPNPTRIYRRARFPNQLPMLGKCRQRVDPMHELGRYAALLEQCGRDLGGSRAERLHARRAMVHVADHEWVEVREPRARLRARWSARASRAHAKLQRPIHLCLQPYAPAPPRPTAAPRAGDAHLSKH